MTRPEIDYGERITVCYNQEVKVWENYDVRTPVRQYVQENKQNLGFIITVYDMGGGFLRSSRYDEVKFRPKLSLLVSDNLSPVVEITSPNGGETFISGDDLEINWKASDDGSISATAIYYSISNGSSWKFIDSTTEKIETYIWTLPEEQYKRRYTLKVAAYDNTGKMNFDICDSTFWVDKVTSIKAGIYGGSNEKIRYQYGSGQQLSLYIPGKENTTVYLADIKGRLITMFETTPDTHWYTLNKKITEGAYIISTSSANRKSSRKIIISQ